MQAILKKVTLLPQQPPLIFEILQFPFLFKDLVGGSTPCQKGEGGGCTLWIGPILNNPNFLGDFEMKFLAKIWLKCFLLWLFWMYLYSAANIDWSPVITNHFFPLFWFLPNLRRPNKITKSVKSINLKTN